MSEMLQHHLYKAVCGFQNVGHFSPVQNLLFKHDVTNANLDVLLGQIAHIQCDHLKHSSRSFHLSLLESSFAIQLPISSTLEGVLIKITQEAGNKTRHRAGFDQSDRIKTLDLPGEPFLATIAASIESAMEPGKAADVRCRPADF